MGLTGWSHQPYMRLPDIEINPGSWTAFFHQAKLAVIGNRVSDIQ